MSIQFFGGDFPDPSYLILLSLEQEVTDAKQVADEIFSLARASIAWAAIQAEEEVAREEARASRVWAAIQAEKEVKTDQVEQENEKNEEGNKGEEETIEQSPTYIPAFAPAEPVTVRSYGNHDITISQGNDQLWYIQSDYFNRKPLRVVVCEDCGFGYPLGSLYSYGIENFTTGRTISAAQPRKKTCVICMFGADC